MLCLYNMYMPRKYTKKENREFLKELSFILAFAFDMIALMFLFVGYFRYIYGRLHYSDYTFPHFYGYCSLILSLLGLFFAVLTDALRLEENNNEFRWGFVTLMLSLLVILMSVYTVIAMLLW